jgi:hypothetical protein
LPVALPGETVAVEGACSPRFIYGDELLSRQTDELRYCIEAGMSDTRALTGVTRSAIRRARKSPRESFVRFGQKFNPKIREPGACHDVYSTKNPPVPIFYAVSAIHPAE